MINKMMSLLPGANGNLPMQTVDIKNLYYQMMPADWQCAFLNSGQVITNINYTLLDLQRFMTLQEEQNQVEIAWRRQQQQLTGRPRAGRHSQSPNRQCAPADCGSDLQRFCVAAATPQLVQNAPQAPVGAPPTY